MICHTQDCDLHELPRITLLPNSHDFGRRLLSHLSTPFTGLLWQRLSEKKKKRPACLAQQPLSKSGVGGNLS